MKGPASSGEVCGISIGIVLAEDLPMVREGLRLLLAAEADFEVVGVAATGSEVLHHR